MSSICIARQWAEDDGLQVTVDVEDEYPDSLNEARSIAIKLFTDALAITLANETNKDDT